jgi:hypothetical protein
VAFRKQENLVEILCVFFYVCAAQGLCYDLRLLFIPFLKEGNKLEL